MPGKIRRLFRWCLKVTEGYAGVELLDMTSSWKDGLAFCAIINRFRPDLIDFYSLSPDDVYHNNDLAFSVMEKEYSITRLLDPSDMVEMESPDRYSIATYVSSFYEVFNDKPMHEPPPVPENWTACKKNVHKHKHSEDDKQSEVIKKQKLEKNSETNGGIANATEECDSDVITNESQELKTADKTNHIKMEEKDNSEPVKSDTHADEHEDSDIDDLFVRSKSVLEDENDTDTFVNMQSYKDLCQDSIDDIKNSKQNVVLQAVVLAGVTAVAATTVSDESENCDKDNSDMNQSEGMNVELKEIMDKHKENEEDNLCTTPCKTTDSEKVDSHEEFDRQDDSLTDSGCFTSTVLNNTLDLDSLDPNSTLKSEVEELSPDSYKTFDTQIDNLPVLSISDQAINEIQTEQQTENSDMEESTLKTSVMYPESSKDDKLEEEPLQSNSIEVDEDVIETWSSEQLSKNQPKDISITKETVDVLNIELNKGEIRIEDVVVVNEKEVEIDEEQNTVDNCEDKFFDRECIEKNVLEEKLEGMEINAVYDHKVETIDKEEVMETDYNQTEQRDDHEKNQNANETYNTVEEPLNYNHEQLDTVSLAEQQTYAEEPVYDEIVDALSDKPEIKRIDSIQTDLGKDHEQNPCETETDSPVEVNHPEHKEPISEIVVQQKTTPEEAVYYDKVDASEIVGVIGSGISPIDQGKDQMDTGSSGSGEAILNTNLDPKVTVSLNEEQGKVDDAVFDTKEAVYDTRVDISDVNDSSPTDELDDQPNPEKTGQSGEANVSTCPEQIDIVSESKQLKDAEETVYNKVKTTEDKEIPDITEKDIDNIDGQNYNKIDCGEETAIFNPEMENSVSEIEQVCNAEKSPKEIIEDECKVEVNIVQNSEINEDYEKETDYEPLEPDTERAFAECMATDIVNNVFEEMKSHPDMLDSGMDIQGIVNEIQVDLEVERASQDAKEFNFIETLEGNKMSFEEEKSLDTNLVLTDSPDRTSHSPQLTGNDSESSRKTSDVFDSFDNMSGKDSPPPALPAVGPPVLIKSDSQDQEIEDLIVESIQEQTCNTPPNLNSDFVITHKDGIKEECDSDLDSNQLIEDYTNVLQEASNNDEGQEIMEMSNGIGDHNGIKILVTPCPQAHENQSSEVIKSHEEKSQKEGTCKTESEIHDRNEAESTNASSNSETDPEFVPVQLLHEDSNVQPVENVINLEDQADTELPSTSDDSLQQQKDKIESFTSPVIYQADVSSAAPVIHNEVNLKEVQDEIFVKDNADSIECEIIYPSLESKDADSLKISHGDENVSHEEKENIEDLVFQIPEKDQQCPSSPRESSPLFDTKDEVKDEERDEIACIGVSKMVASVDDKDMYIDNNEQVELKQMEISDADVIFTPQNSDHCLLAQPDSINPEVDLDSSDKETPKIIPGLNESLAKSNSDLISEACDSIISSQSNECVPEKGELSLDEIVKESLPDTDSLEKKPHVVKEEMKEGDLVNMDKNNASINTSEPQLPDEKADQTGDLTNGKDTSIANKEKELHNLEVKAVPVKMGEVKLDWSTKLSDPNGNIAKEVSLQFSAPISAEGDTSELSEPCIEDKAYAEIDKDLLRKAAIMSKKMAEKVTMRILDDQKHDLNNSDVLSNNQEGKDFEIPGTPPPTPDISHETAKERRQAMFQILQNSTRPTKKKFEEEEDLKTDEKNLDFTSKMKLWNRRSFTSSDLPRKSSTEIVPKKRISLTSPFLSSESNAPEKKSTHMDIVPKKRISLTSPFLSSESSAPDTKDTHMAKLTKILPDKPAPGSVAEYVRKISERKTPPVEEKSKRLSRSDSDAGSDKSFDGKERYSRNVWIDIPETNDSEEKGNNASENKDQNTTSKTITPSAIFSQRPVVKMRSKNNNVKIPVRPLSVEVRYEEETKDSSKPPLPPSRPSRKSLGKVNLNIKSIDKKVEEDTPSDSIEEKEALQRQDSLKKRSSPKRSLSLSSPTRSRSSSGERERNVWTDQSTKPPSPKLKRNDSFEVKIRPVISQKSPEEKYADKKEKEIERESSSKLSSSPPTPRKSLSKVDVSVLPVSAQEEDGQESSSTEKPIRGGRRSLLSLIGSIKKPKEDKSPLNNEIKISSNGPDPKSNDFKDEEKPLSENTISNDVPDPKSNDLKGENKPTLKLYNVVKAAVEKEKGELVPEPSSQHYDNQCEENTNIQDLEEKIILQVNTPVQMSLKPMTDESKINGVFHQEKENTIKKCNSIFSSTKPKKMSEKNQIATDQMNDNVDNSINLANTYLVKDKTDQSSLSEVNRQTNDLITIDHKEELPVKERNQNQDKTESKSSESSSEDDDNKNNSKNSSAEINRIDLKEGLEAIIKDIEKEIDTQYGIDTVAGDMGHEEEKKENTPNDSLFVKKEIKDERASPYTQMPTENQIVFRVTLNDKQIDPKGQEIPNQSPENTVNPVIDTKMSSIENIDIFNEIKTIETHDNKNLDKKKSKKKKKIKGKCSDSSSESSQPDTDESDKDEFPKKQNGGQKDSQTNGQSIPGSKKERKVLQGSEKSSNSSESQESDSKDDNYMIETEIDLNIDNDQEIFASIDVGLQDHGLFVQDSIESTDFPDDIIQLSCDKDYVLIEKKQDLDTNEFYVNESFTDVHNSTKSNKSPVHYDNGKIPKLDNESVSLPNTDVLLKHEERPEKESEQNPQKSQVNENLVNKEKPDILHNLPSRDSKLTTSSESDSESGSNSDNKNIKKDRKKKRKHKRSPKESGSSNSDSDTEGIKDDIQKPEKDLAKEKDKQLDSSQKKIKQNSYSSDSDSSGTGPDEAMEIVPNNEENNYESLTESVSDPYINANIYDQLFEPHPENEIIKAVKDADDIDSKALDHHEQEYQTNTGAKEMENPEFSVDISVADQPFSKDVEKVVLNEQSQSSRERLSSSSSSSSSDSENEDQLTFNNQEQSNKADISVMEEQIPSRLEPLESIPDNELIVDTENVTLPSNDKQFLSLSTSSVCDIEVPNVSVALLDSDSDMEKRSLKSSSSSSDSDVELVHESEMNIQNTMYEDLIQPKNDSKVYGKLGQDEYEEVKPKEIDVKDRSSISSPSSGNSEGEDKNKTDIDYQNELYTNGLERISEESDKVTAADVKRHSSSSSSSSSSDNEDETAITKETSFEALSELDPVVNIIKGNLSSEEIVMDDISKQVKNDISAEIMFGLDSAGEIEPKEIYMKEKQSSISSTSSIDSGVQDKNNSEMNNKMSEDLTQPKEHDSERLRLDDSEDMELQKTDLKDRKSSISSTSSSESNEDDAVVLSDVEEIPPQPFKETLPLSTYEKPEFDIDMHGDVKFENDKVNADKHEDVEFEKVMSLESKMNQCRNDIVEELGESGNRPRKLIEDSIQESENKVLLEHREQSRQNSESSSDTSIESYEDNNVETEQTEKEKEIEHEEQRKPRQTLSSSSSSSSESDQENNVEMKKEDKIELEEQKISKPSSISSNSSFESAQEEIDSTTQEDQEDNLLKIVIEDSQPFKAPLLETVVTSDTESNEIESNEVALQKSYSSDDLYTNDEKDFEEKMYLLPECNMIKTEYDEMNMKGSGLPYNILDVDYKPEPIDIQVFVIPDRPIDMPLLKNLESRDSKDIVLVDDELDKTEPSVVMSLESLPEIKDGDQVFYDNFNTDDYLVPRDLKDIILEPVSTDMSVCHGQVEEADLEDYLLQNIIQDQARVPVIRKKKSTSSSSSCSEDINSEREYENTGLDDEHIYQSVDYDDKINEIGTEQYEDGEIYEDIIDDDVKDVHKNKHDSSETNECYDDMPNTETEMDIELYKTGDILPEKEFLIHRDIDVNKTEVVKGDQKADISGDKSESSDSSSSSDSSDDENENNKDLKLNPAYENINSEVIQKQLSDVKDEPISALVESKTIPASMTIEDSIVPDNVRLEESMPDNVTSERSVPDDVILEESFIPHNVILNESVVPVDITAEESNVPIDVSAVSDNVIVAEPSLTTDLTFVESIVPDNVTLEKSTVPLNIDCEELVVPSHVTSEEAYIPDKVHFEALDVQDNVIIEDTVVPNNFTFKGIIVPDNDRLEEKIQDKRIFGDTPSPDGQQSRAEANFMIGREKDPSKSEVARLIQQSLELDRKREELRRQEQERLQDSIHPRDEVLEKEHQKHLQDTHVQLEREEENVDLDESSLEDEVEAEEKEISEGQFSEEYQAGEATPMSMPSGVDTDNSVSSPEEGESKPVVEVFDLQESSSEDISPDMESQALFVKLKEAQLRIAVLEAELAKLKARLIVLENAETQKKQLEKKNEEMAARLRETEKSLTNTRKEINHYQDLLEGSQGQYIKLEKKMSGDFTALEKKYHKAKKLIKEYQQREKDFVAERESLLQQQTEKDQQYNALVKSLKDKIFLLEGDLREAQKAAGLPVLSQSHEPMSLKSEPIVTPVSVKPVRSAPLVHDSGSPLMSPVGDKDSMSSESESSSADVINTEGVIRASKVDLFESMPVTEPLDTSIHKAKAQVANNSRRPPTKQRSKSQDSDEMMEGASNKDESGLETWIKHDSDNTVKKSDVRKRKAQQQGLDPQPQSPPSETANTEPSEIKVTVIEPLTPEEKLPPPPPPPSDTLASLPDSDPVVPARERGDSESNDSSSTVSQSSYDPTKPNFRSKDSEIPGLDTGSVDFPESHETESESSSISAKKPKGFNLPKLPFKFGGSERDKGGVMLISSRSINTGEEQTSNEGGITLISKRKLDTGIDFDGASTISTVSDTSSGYMVGEQESTSYSFSGTPASEDHPSHPTAHVQNQFQSSPISEWNTEHVRTWLIGVEMDKYIPLFTDKSINGLQLVNLDANKLKAMGISNTKDRDILKKKVKELKLVLEKERKQLEKERKQMEKEQKAKEKEQKKLSKKK